MARHPSKFFRHTYFPALQKPERGRVYLFLGFGGKTAVYSPAILRLCRHGFSVVAISFHTRMSSEERIATLPKRIDAVCQTVAAYEARRKTKTQAIAFGNSMGSVYAWHVAQRIPSIDKVVANTAYALISKMIFEWKGSWYNNLIRDGYTQETFHQAIADIEPIAHFDKLKGKRVLLCMNRDDPVINFEHAQLFKDALEKYGIEYEYLENRRVSHAGAVVRNIMSKRVLDFLKS